MATKRRPRAKVLQTTRVARIRDAQCEDSVRILELVNRLYGSGDGYLEEVWGSRISKKDAQHCLEQYLKDEGLCGKITLKWSSTLPCSACVISYHYPARRNRIESTNFSLVVNSTTANFYLRERSMIALADHEVGTHYVSPN